MVRIDTLGRVEIDVGNRSEFVVALEGWLAVGAAEDGGLCDRRGG